MDTMLRGQGLWRAGLWACFLVTLGCGSSPGVGPQPAPTPLPFAVSLVTPNTGSAGTRLRITGSGFRQGVLVSVGGVDATDVFRGSDFFVLATAPPHDVGPVDIVVTNPGGERVAMAGGFSYIAPLEVSLSVAPTTVPTGGQLQVSWAASQGGRSVWDWIGIFQIGDSNFDYQDYQYTDGLQSGTQNWVISLPPGQYEFRYLLDDGYEDVAHSAPVTVGTGSTPAGVRARPMTRRGRGGRR